MACSSGPGLCLPALYGLGFLFMVGLQNLGVVSLYLLGGLFHCHRIQGVVGNKIRYRYSISMRLNLSLL